MEQETKVTLRNYAICIAVELLIGFLVIWSKGFFTQSTAVNLQILADAFFVAGIMMTLVAGLIFVSREGGLIGIGYVMKSVFLFFIPMGRAKWERYGDYRERKLERIKDRNCGCVLVTGLVFHFIGIVLTLIWYRLFYHV